MSIRKTVFQKFVYRPYTVGTCDCDSAHETPPPLRCENNDWQVESRLCLNGEKSTLVCSRLDPQVCPSLGGTKGTPSWAILSDDPTTPQVQCEYPASALQSESALADYERVWGRDSTFFTLVAPANCFTTTNQCPVDPLTGKPMPLCSRYVSTGPEGITCRSWGQTPGNETVASRAMDRYCADHFTPDCFCVTRASNATYQELKTANPNEDACWWKPCAAPETFLVPPLLLHPTSCDSVRKDIADKIDDRGSTFDCCDLKNFVVYAPNGIEQPITCTFIDAGKPQLFWLGQYGWIVLGIVLGVVLLLALVVVFAYAT